VQAARTLRTWASLGGLATAVLFVVGAILLFDGPSDSSPAKMTAYYTDAGHRNTIHIGWVLTGFGVFAFLWFLAALREAVAETERSNPSDGTLLSTLVTVGGGVFAAVAIVVIGSTDGLKTMSDDTYQHTVYSGVIHGAGDAGYSMLVTGGVALAVMIFAASAWILSAHALPRWLGWFGLFAGLCAIVSLFFFTMLVWLLWLAVMSIVLFAASRRRAPVAALA
jgi:hypothetical protein